MGSDRFPRHLAVFETVSFQANIRAHHPLNSHHGWPLARCMFFQKVSTSKKHWKQAASRMLSRIQAEDFAHPSVQALAMYIDGKVLLSQRNAFDFKPCCWLILPWHPVLKYARFGRIIRKYAERFTEFAEISTDEHWLKCRTRVGYRLGDRSLLSRSQALQPTI